MSSCGIRRADNRVTIRGYRIEQNHVEAALAGPPGVEQAVAIARQDRPGDQRLVGYVTESLFGQEKRRQVGARD
jgi:nonribosomal peptide synthetase DhbF